MNCADALSLASAWRGAFRQTPMSGEQAWRAGGGVLEKSPGGPICAGRRGLWVALPNNTTSVGLGAE